VRDGLVPRAALCAGDEPPPKRRAADANGGSGRTGDGEAGGGGGGVQVDAALSQMSERCARRLIEVQQAAEGTKHRDEECPLCFKRVGPRSEWSGPVCAARCDGGHELARCWACLGVLPLDAWTCFTCGAGFCLEHSETDLASTPLGALGGRSMCGLCGSVCQPPRMVMMGL
jgi:hypothetical protein